MQNRLRYILSAGILLMTICASAEVVRLKSGDIIRGSIIFQNDEVLVIKKADGSRFQYLKNDVEEVLDEEEEEATKEETATVTKEKKVTAGLQLASGMAILPGNSAGSLAQKGGGMEADLFIGTGNLLTSPSGGRYRWRGMSFLGAGLGYHLNYIGGRPYSFLPIQLRAEASLAQGKHAPMLGLSAGYGISLQRSAKGGAYADLTFGWRGQLADGRAISLGLFGNFQQTKLTNHTDIIDGNAFVAPSAGRAFVNFGLRLATYL